MPGGRPTIMTPELLSAVYKRVEETGDVVGSCVAEGVAVDTVYSWLRRGKGEDKDRPQTDWSIEFVKRMEAARAAHRNTLLARELQTRTETKVKTIKLPNGGEMKTAEVKKIEADPATIDRHLRREYPKLYPKAPLIDARSVTVNLDREFEAIEAEPFTDPRNFPLEGKEPVALAEIVVDKERIIADFMAEGDDSGK